MKQVLRIYYLHELAFLRLVEEDRLFAALLALQTLFVWFLAPFLVVLPLGKLLEPTGFAMIAVTGLAWLCLAWIVLGMFWIFRLFFFLGEVEVFRTDPLGSHRGTKLRMATIEQKLGAR